MTQAEATDKAKPFLSMLANCKAIVVTDQGHVHGGNSVDELVALYTEKGDYKGAKTFVVKQPK